MVLNYLRTAWLTFRQLKTASLMHVLGLSAGLACAVVSYQFIEELRSSDLHFANAPRTYALTQKLWIGNSASPMPAFPRVAAPAADYLRTDFPQLEAVARALPIGRMAASVGERNAFLYGALVDPDFLRIFPMRFLAGNPQQALAAANGAVITEAVARRLFGSTEIIGRRLSAGGTDMVITGVIAAVPQPSHMGDSPQSLLRFDMLMQLSPAQLNAGTPDWTDNRYLTYVLLPASGLNANAFKVALQTFGERHMPKSQGRAVFATAPVSAIRLSALDALAPTTGLSIVTSLFLLNGLVLAIACFNYANLATALALRRSREIAMRKVLGAHRRHIAAQCLIDAALVGFVAIIGALLVAAAMIPALNAGLALHLNALRLTEPSFWLLLVLLVAAVALLAGTYPAIALSRLRPVQALQAGSARTGRRYVPTLLVGLQFAITGFLLILALVAQNQNRVLTRSVADATKDPEIVITTRIGEANLDLQTLRTELLRSPHIRSVSAADELPWEGGGGWHFLVTRDPEAAAKPIEVSANRVWYDFFDALELRMLAGRTFNRSFADETDIPAIIQGRAQPLAVVVDRDLAARLGWASPTEAVGKLIYRPSPGVGAAQLTLQIVGVVENGYPRLTGSGAETNLFLLMPTLVNYPIVRLDPQHVQAALADIDATWKLLAPQTPLELRFTDELFAQTYATFSAVGSVATGLAAFAFVISLMGLFAMAVYVTTERLREIGVRKTLGASPLRIFRMLLLDFSKPIVAANLIAWPFAYFAAEAYLSMFLKRTDVSLPPFVLSLVITLLIAWLTVAGQALRAARMQPAAILRLQ